MMRNGEIIKSGGPEVALEIEKDGFAKFEK